MVSVAEPAIIIKTKVTCSAVRGLNRSSWHIDLLDRSKPVQIISEVGLQNPNENVMLVAEDRSARRTRRSVPVPAK